MAFFISLLYFYFICEAEKKLLLLHKPACFCLPFQFSILSTEFLSLSRRPNCTRFSLSLSLSIPTVSVTAFEQLISLAFSFYTEKIFLSLSIHFSFFLRSFLPDLTSFAVLRRVFVSLQDPD